MRAPALRLPISLAVLFNVAVFPAAPAPAPASAQSPDAATPKRALVREDFDRFLEVDGVVCSRDGAWMAYTVAGADLDADDRKSSIWMVNFQGTEDIRLSSTPGGSASNPEFSPDGRYVSFLAARGPDSKRQLYLLDRRGGEAQPLTSVTGEIADYAWSSDGSRIVIAMSATDEAKTPKPIVIDRLRFKQDIDGYLTSTDRSQLYVVDVAGKQITPLTTDNRYQDTSPVWSPDGKTIAYFSTRGTTEGVSGTLGLYLIDARAGAEPRKITEFYAPNKPSLSWTADGTRLLYTTGLEPRLNAYIQDRLTVVSLSDGKPHVLTEHLDRAVSFPVPSADGRVAYAILEDDGSEVPVALKLDTGGIESRLPGKLSASSLCSGG